MSNSFVTFTGLDPESKTEVLENIKKLFDSVDLEKITFCEQNIEYEPVPSDTITHWKPVSFGTTLKFSDPVSGEEITVVFTTKVTDKPNKVQNE